MRLEQLHHIIEINNKRSISEAARTFFMGQPQLSHSLKDLEAELGYRIFRRNKAGLIPTCQGKEVIELAREIINSVEEMRTIASGQANLIGNLSLALGTAVFNAFAAPLLERFNQIYPNANLMVTEGSASEVIEKVATRTCMMGVTGWPDNQDETMRKILDSQNIAYEEVAKDLFRLIVGSQHPLAQKENITLADLEGMTFIDYCGMTQKFLRMLNIQLPENQSILVYDRQVMKAIIALNQGIAIFPRFFSINDDYFKQGVLNMRAFEDEKDNMKVTMYLIYSREEPLPLLAQRLMDMVKKTIGYYIQY